ncbi:MAG: hypothetical protein WAQ53_09665 [Thiofilum sp.]|uniref:hypothetical protein n=1 Tax=Thiofilum sp. TaxID=2212733 RepID=UPI0025F9CF10|nr:hypothetical protein [Thiofilum sp.]MBK8453125.1 hypothetical protein [Thiofilum sp.]
MQLPITFYYQNTYTSAYELLLNAIQQSDCHALTKQYDAFSIDVYALLDKPRSKIVAIDWDNTITADIGFYQQLIDTYQQKGWTPIICTLRAPSPENLAEIRTALQRDDITIYATDGRSKQAFLKRHKINVHLWLDDYFPAICKDGCTLLRQNGITHYATH